MRLPRLPARLLALAFLAACTPTGGSGQPEGGRHGVTRPVDEPDDPIAQTAFDEHGRPTLPTAWEVHEWGVLSVDGAQLDRGRWVAGPAGTMGGAPLPQGKKRKPVLYVHLGKGVDAVTFALDVAPTRGRVVEHWPRTATGGAPLDSISWQEVRARVGACDGRRVRYPVIGSPECASVDGVCEVAELATVETADGVCLEFGGETYEHLFYRAELDGLELGLALARRGSGEWELENHGPSPVETALHVTAGGLRGGARVERLPEVGAGASAVFGGAGTGAGGLGLDYAGAIAWLEAGLRERGLTGDEADAFVRAWGSDLFAAVRPPTTLGDEGRRSQPAGSELLLLWLDRATVDALVPLKFSPAPSALERAHLLVIQLPPGG